MTRDGLPFEDADKRRPRDEAADAAVAVGQVVAGRFAIERLAGRGGMGAVYRAIDLQHNVPVAFKCILRNVSRNRARLMRESSVLAQLSHPSIVRYVAHGVTESGAPYLVMEWLEGEDLAARLAGAGLEVSETVQLIRRVAEGLAVAHARGVVHRDLKPSNIFLAGGRVEAAKLLDFGVARDADPHEGSKLTGTGRMIGTVGYMSPEQALGARDLDASADTFALGCVMFACLTGRDAFCGPHDIAVLAALLRDEAPRVRTLRPDIDESLDALVASMLSTERSGRPRDAQAVLDALDKLGEVGRSQPPLRRASTPPLIASERKIASVIVARGLWSESGSTSQGAGSAMSAAIDAVLKRFDAEPIPLRAGQFVLIFGAGAETVASDQAVQAVRCALRLTRLESGLVCTVATGEVASSLKVAVGVAIDRAAALLDGPPAPNRQILLDDLTASMVEGRFELTRSSTGVVVVAEHEETERPRLLLGKPSPFVGRQKELVLLEGTLAEAIGDEVARVLLVTAEPGTGKSRLAREFLERLDPSATRTLFARADLLTRRSAQGLVQQLVARTIGVREGDPVALRAQCLRAAMEKRGEAQHRGWLTEFLGELIGAPTDEPPSPLLLAARNDPAIMHEQTRRAFQRWFTDEVAEGPLLLLLEDLHWADPPSLAMLEEALRTLADRPLFVLAFARLDVHDHFPNLWRGIACQEYRLRGLTRRAAERLVRDALPMPVGDALVERVVALAQGNAFYLEELTRHVAEGESELPATVIAMAQSRLERLSPDARRLLRAASVFGEASWVGAVAALIGSEEEAASGFQQLTRDEIFVQCDLPRFPGETEYAFRHALLRDAAYAMLTEDDCQLAHGLAGAWLEAAGERDPCVLADHFEASNHPQRAVPWLRQAARAALASGDLTGAVALAQRGLRFVPDAGAPARADLLLVIAHASAWRMQPNLELAREALSVFPLGTNSWWFALSLMVFGTSAIGRADLTMPYLELAHSAPPPPDARLGMYGQAFEVLAVGAAVVGRADVAWKLLDELRATLDRLPQPDTLSRAWLDTGYCQLATNSLCDGTWQLERALNAGRAAVAAMREVGAVHGEGTAMLHLGICWFELGCYPEAEQTLHASLECARQVGNELIAEYARLMLAVFALRSGDSAGGLSELERLAQSSDANIVHGTKTVRAEAVRRSGDVDEALRLGAEAALGPGLVYRVDAALTLARSYRMRGEPERALSIVERAIEARGPNAFPHLTVRLEAMRAELASAIGDHTTARDAARRAVRFVEQTAASIHDPRLRASFTQKLQLGARVTRLSGDPLPAG